MGWRLPNLQYNEEEKGIAFLQGRSDFGLRSPTAGVFCTDSKYF